MRHYKFDLSLFFCYLKLLFVKQRIDYRGPGPQVWVEKLHNENKSYEDRAAFCCFFPGPLGPHSPLQHLLLKINCLSL